MAAKESVGFAPHMATNGWVVGPLPDRAIFDEVLPLAWDAITSIDLNTGHAPVDPSYLNVTRHPKWAIPWMEDDGSMTAVQLWINRTLVHMDTAHAYGCSGLLGIHWRTTVTAPAISAMGLKAWQPALDSTTFWREWAQQQFGTDANASAQLAAVFESVDSFAMPTIVLWKDGPGNLEPGHCGEESRFTFVDALSAAGAGVVGAQNRARLEYWQATFAYQRAIARTECAWAESNTAMVTVANASTPAERRRLARTIGLPARIALVSNATELIGFLHASIASSGELGTLMNLEAHSFPALLNDRNLSAYLGVPLPPAAVPSAGYTGTAPRLIVPTARSTARRGEAVAWRMLLLGGGVHGCTGVHFFVRPMGSSVAYSRHDLKRAGRGVFTLRLNPPDLPHDDFEWYAVAAGGGPRCADTIFPAGAPTVTQTVVWMSSERR